MVNQELVKGYFFQIVIKSHITNLYIEDDGTKS